MRAARCSSPSEYLWFRSLDTPHEERLIKREGCSSGHHGTKSTDRQYMAVAAGGQNARALMFCSLGEIVDRPFDDPGPQLMLEARKLHSELWILDPTVCSPL